jgi:lipase maturation factor
MTAGPDERASWVLARRAFLCGIALTYLVAFVSLGVQVRGLFGSEGIVPLAERMQLLRENLHGLERLRFPTCLWLGASDADLSLLCWAGALAAGSALLGFLPRATLLLCWALYLSLVAVGSPFLDFQWDALLLEAGLLAVLYAPGGLRPFGRGESEPSALVRWLVYALLFKLLVLSGATKLLSGDESWKDGSALDFHYWTQPLPHRLSVYADAAPPWFQRASVLVMFAVELGLPWLLLVPYGRRRLRQVVAAGTFALMTAIFLTGNYGFFNLLTAVLALPLIDDRAWRELLRRPHLPSPHLEPRPAPVWRARVLAGIAAPLALVSAMQLAEGLEWLRSPPAPLLALGQLLAPLRSVNPYGLFRVMTRERLEIRIEGSADGTSWRPYRFRYKPDELERPPVFAGLHMPRLDWQLWFAALEHGSPRRSRWVSDLLDHLLAGSPSVLALFAENPFPAAPPLAVRATIAPYRFAPADERARGLWWRRGAEETFLPARAR